MYRDRTNNYILFFMSCALFSACMVCRARFGMADQDPLLLFRLSTFAGFLCGACLTGSYLYRAPVTFEDMSHWLSDEEQYDDEF